MNNDTKRLIIYVINCTITGMGYVAGIISRDILFLLVVGGLYWYNSFDRK